MTADPVQCVCGRLKQLGFICDFCYSTEDNDECPAGGPHIFREHDESPTPRRSIGNSPRSMNNGPLLRPYIVCSTAHDVRGANGITAPSCDFSGRILLT